MSIISRVLVALVLSVMVGGAAFLATWDPPSPTARVERVIPNDRFDH